MSIEIIGLRFTHRKSINPSLYGPFFNYFGGGILRYYLQLKDLEKNPQADVNKLAEQSAAKLRLKCDTGVCHP